jgi:hypothetical protein
MNKEALFDDEQIIKYAINTSDDIIHDLKVCLSYLNLIQPEELSKELVLRNLENPSPKSKKRNIFSIVGELYSGSGTFPLTVYRELYPKDEILGKHEQLGHKYPFMSHDAYTDQRIKQNQFTNKNFVQAKQGLKEFTSFYNEVEKKLNDSLKEKTKVKTANVLLFPTFTKECYQYANKEFYKTSSLKRILRIASFLR